MLSKNHLLTRLASMSLQRKDSSIKIDKVYLALLDVSQCTIANEAIEINSPLVRGRINKTLELTLPIEFCSNQGIIADKLKGIHLKKKTKKE